MGYLDMDAYINCSNSHPYQHLWNNQSCKRMVSNKACAVFDIMAQGVRVQYRKYFIAFLK